MVRAPAGTWTDAAGPTSAMRPSRITIVWSGLGAAPVPSTRSTCASATKPESTTTYWRTSVASESGRCAGRDRKSTRLNSSHGYISYAVFCLKKKKHKLGAILFNVNHVGSHAGLRHATDALLLGKDARHHDAHLQDGHLQPPSGGFRQLLCPH